jgi:alkanesulfonate monooxygenase SsuD/methylene tetrahydromethanopterin reductase-like flavin-dependent oxidoreductase (luciferase family)
MKVDTILAAGDWQALPGEARRLEEAGYDAAWTAEVSHDPFLPLAVVAGATARMSLGTLIAVAFARSPMTTAYIANDSALPVMPVMSRYRRPISGVKSV